MAPYKVNLLLLQTKIIEAPYLLAQNRGSRRGVAIKEHVTQQEGIQACWLCPEKEPPGPRAGQPIRHSCEHLACLCINLQCTKSTLLLEGLPDLILPNLACLDDLTPSSADIEQGQSGKIKGAC